MIKRYVEGQEGWFHKDMCIQSNAVQFWSFGTDTTFKDVGIWPVRQGTASITYNWETFSRSLEPLQTL